MNPILSPAHLADNGYIPFSVDPCTYVHCDICYRPLTQVVTFVHHDGRIVRTGRWCATTTMDLITRSLDIPSFLLAGKPASTAMIVEFTELIRNVAHTADGGLARDYLMRRHALEWLPRQHPAWRTNRGRHNFWILPKYRDWFPEDFRRDS